MSYGDVLSRMTGGKAISGIGMEHSRLRKPSLSQREHVRPRESTLLTPAAKGAPPEPKRALPEHRFRLAHKSLTAGESGRAVISQSKIFACAP